MRTTVRRPSPWAPILVLALLGCLLATSLAAEARGKQGGRDSDLAGPWVRLDTLLGRVRGAVSQVAAPADPAPLLEPVIPGPPADPPRAAPSAPAPEPTPSSASDSAPPPAHPAATGCPLGQAGGVAIAAARHVALLAIVAGGVAAAAMVRRR